MEESQLYRAAAELLNNDFGGLHYDRLGISPTVRNLLQLTFLGPDWTLSNTRSVVKAFSGGLEGQVHREFWMRVASRWAVIWLAGTALAAGFDDRTLKSRDIPKQTVEYKRYFVHLPCRKLHWKLHWIVANFQYSRFVSLVNAFIYLLSGRSESNRHNQLGRLGLYH